MSHKNLVSVKPPVIFNMCRGGPFNSKQEGKVGKEFLRSLGKRVKVDKSRDGAGTCIRLQA